MAYGKQMVDDISNCLDGSNAAFSAGHILHSHMERADELLCRCSAAILQVEDATVRHIPVYCRVGEQQLMLYAHGHEQAS